MATTTRGGSDGFEGYHYQVLVSIWVALDVLLVSKRAERIELEPASHEDLEADLDDERPPVAGSSVPAPTYTLRIQVKRRSEPWDIARFRTLMGHGGAQRKAARSRLVDEPAARYLLITNAAAINTVEPFEVSDIDVWPAGDLPSLWKSGGPADPASVSKRVAILSNCKDDLVLWKIESHLTSVCHVPKSRWKACAQALYREAMQRMRPDADNLWRRSDLEEAIKKHEGYLTRTRDELEYVKPKNWLQMLDRLENHHAIIIKGESGTGKTAAALALLGELRERVPGLERISAETPSVVAECTARPVVFYLNDPWGTSRFEPNAEPWRNQLSSFLQRAGPDCYFVATTRSDVYEAAKLGNVHERWLLALESSDYEPRDRFTMYRNRLKNVPAALRHLVADRRGHVLQKLRKPFEIDRFFSNLNGSPVAETEEGRVEQVEKATSQAQIDAIQDNIREQVKQRDATTAAIVLWAVLAVSETVSRAHLRKVHTRYVRLSPSSSRLDLDELVSFFVAGNSLRADDNGLISYVHPQVRAALRTFVEDSLVHAQEVLRLVCEAHLRIDEQPGKAWAAEALARLSAALPGEVDKLEVFDDEAASLMNAWLVERCLQSEGDFEDGLKRLARAGTPNFVPAEMARFLTEVGIYSPFAEDEFVAFDVQHEWVVSMAADERVRALCARYVVTALPFGMYCLQDDFLDVIERVAGEITVPCLAALSGVIGSGSRSQHVGLLLHYAERDIVGLRSVAVEALKLYQSLDFSTSEEDSIAIEDCYFGDDFPNGPPYDWESASNAEEVLEHYVNARRLQDGWQALAQDTECQGMEEWWLNVASKAEARGSSVTDGEVEELWNRVNATGSEHRFWQAAYGFWRSGLRERLISRLVEGDREHDLRSAVLWCAKLVDDGAHIAAAVGRLGELQMWSEVLDLMSDFMVHTHFDSDSSGTAEVRSVLSSLPETTALMLDCVLLESPLPPGCSAEDFDAFLLSLFPKSERALGVLAKAKAGRALDASLELAELLNSSNKGDLPAEVIRALGSDVTELELLEATRHRFGKVRAAALEMLAERGYGIGSELLVKLSLDRSWYTKSAAVGIASSRPDLYRDVLLVMLMDGWTDELWAMNDEAVYHPFARDACAALTATAGFSQEDEEAFMKAGFSSRDARLRADVLKHVALKGTRASREFLVLICLTDGPHRGKGEAASALASNFECVEADVVAAIGIEHLLELDAFIAIRLAKVVGRCAPPDVVRVFAERLRDDPERRVLLLPLGIGASYNAELLRAIVGMLPTGHEARRVFTTSNAGIPSECLNDLGGHDEVREIREALKRWFNAPESEGVFAPATY